MMLNDLLSQGPTALVSPNYNVYEYTEGIYKIVNFKHPRLLADSCAPLDRSRKGNTCKLAPALSRAKKVVLELALCNRWEWFATFTLDKTKYDRYNLDKWYKDFTQWIRDQRKKHGCSIRYVLVPELHADGAWHMHGLLCDVPGVSSFFDLRKSGQKVPNKLVDGGYFCWSDYQSKFGFNSLGVIQDPVACAFYITEYVGKDLSGTTIPVGRHLYYATQRLNRSVLLGSVYGDSPALNSYLSNDYEWCRTGFTTPKDGVTWDQALDWLHFPTPSLPLVDYGQEPVYQPCAEWYDMQEYLQTAMEGFL